MGLSTAEELRQRGVAFVQIVATKVGADAPGHLIIEGDIRGQRPQPECEGIGRDEFGALNATVKTGTGRFCVFACRRGEPFIGRSGAGRPDCARI